MRLRIKKAVCGFLTTAMIFGIFTPILAAQNQSNAAVPTIKSIFNLDFGEGAERANNFGFSYMTGGTVFPDYVDKEHGRSLRLQQNQEDTSAQAYLLLDKPVDSGVYYLSYEVMHKDKTSYSTVSFLGKEINEAKELTDFLRPMAFTSAGKYGVLQYFNTTGDQVSFDPYLGSKDYNANQWYKVEQWIDFDNNMIYIYINGTELVKNVIPDYFPEMYGVRFMQDKQGKASSVYDNIIFAKLTNSLLTNLKATNSPIPYPHRNACDVQTTFKSEHLGNIYTDKEELCFNLEIKNIADKNISKKAEFKVYDEYEKEVWSTQKSLMIKANEKTDEKLTIDIGDKKGFFTLRASYSEESGKSEFSETRFSVMNIPEKQNYVWGYNNHFDRNGGKTAEFSKLLKTAGFSLVRVGSTTMQWDTAEKSKGIYNIPKPAEDAWDVSVDADMDIMQLLYGANPLYSEELTPYSDDTLNGFANFCAEVVKKAGDRAEYFEVWNEYNHFWTFNKDQRPPEAYVKMLKFVVPKIKAANKNAKIVGYSPSGVAADWCRQVSEFGGLEYCDIISIHPYSQNMSIEAYGWVDKIQEVRDMLKEYGHEDMEIWASEMGFSSASVGGDNMQAAFAIRMMLLNEYHDLMQRIMWYTSQNHQVSTPHEQNFGLVRMWTYEDIPFEAKPILLAIANYNDIMNEAVPTETWKDDGKTATYRFKSEKGEDILVPYSLDGKAVWSAQTDAEWAILSDMYGNTQKIKAVDGRFTLVADDNPVYLIADNFGTVKPYAQPIIETEKTEIIGVANDFSEIKFKINTDKDLRFETVCSEGISVSEEGKDGDAYRIKFALGEKADGKIVTVKALCDGIVCYENTFGVEYNDGVKLELNLKPHDGGSAERWIAVLDIENSSYNTPISGRFEIEEPASLKKSMGGIDLGIVNGQENKSVSFLMPEFTYRTNLKGKCVLSNGNSYELGGEYKVVAADYAKNLPVIDGVVDENEWRTSYKIDQSMCEVVIADYSGAEDVSIENSRLMWDDEYFYLLAVVRDNAQSHEVGQERIWAGDSIQFSMSSEKEKNAPRTEIGFGLGSDGTVKVERTYFMGTDPVVDFNGYDIQIKRDEDNKITTYEMKMPWSRILPNNEKPIPGKELYFSMLLNDNDTGTRRGWVKFGEGIDTEKNPALFNEIHILKSDK